MQPRTTPRTPLQLRLPIRALLHLSQPPSRTSNAPRPASSLCKRSHQSSPCNPLRPRWTYSATLCVRGGLTLQPSVSEVDLSTATVVFLFLLPGLNARLQPRLAAQLRPGARVLSAEFQASGRQTVDRQ